jgi:hypothetical protein
VVTSHFAQAGFHNFRVVFANERVRVDYCVDRAPQLPKLQRGGIRVDTLLDILANKVVALLDFPEPKHAVDLYFGIRSGAHTFDDILTHAKRKRDIDAYHLARGLHAASAGAPVGLEMVVPVEAADFARCLGELRDRVLGGLRPAEPK